MGAVTGGLGGYGGGQLGGAAKGLGAGAAGAVDYGTVSAGTQGMIPANIGSTEGLRGLAQNVPTAGGSTYSATTAGRNLFTNPGDVISNLGGGDMTKGALKAGAIGLPAVAGAMVPEYGTAPENPMAKYDPNRRLNLKNLHSGLRLNQPYAQFADGGYLSPEDQEAYRQYMQQRELEELMYRQKEAPVNEGPRPSRAPKRRNAEMQKRQAEIQRRQMYGYQEGGYLETGMGDGMSDDIATSIEGEQPARLSENEFVVPADVVSHLGNGSSDAGAEQLYAMMDRIREARTGTEEQGREISAERFLPA
jgi:hypothetical protein